MDITNVAQLVLSELGKMGVSKIEVIGHKKSHRVEISLECEIDSYPVILNRLSAFVSELNDPEKLSQHLQKIQKEMDKKIEEQKQ